MRLPSAFYRPYPALAALADPRVTVRSAVAEAFCEMVNRATIPSIARIPYAAGTAPDRNRAVARRVRNGTRWFFTSRRRTMGAAPAVHC